MATLFDYYNTGDNSYLSTITGDVWVAQTFTPARNFVLTKMKLKVFVVPNANDVTISIQKTDASGHPDGTDLVTLIVTDADSTWATGTNGDWEDIIVDPQLLLKADVKYAIVIRCLTPDGGKGVGWRRDTSFPTYTGGCYEYSADAGVNWSSSTNVDYMFELWGAEMIVNTMIESKSWKW